MINKHLLLLIAVFIFFTACANATPLTDDFGKTEESTTKAWQEAYVSLLRENYAGVRFSDCGNLSGRIRFFLHDIDTDGLPELFVLNSLDELATVYTFRSGEVVQLEYDPDEIDLVRLGS